MRRVKVILVGSYNDLKIVEEYQNLLIKYGNHILAFTSDINEADMKVDITELDDTVDLVKQSNYTIQSAKEIKKTIKKRKRILREIVATSK